MITIKDYRYKENLIVEKIEGKSDLTWTEIQNAVGDYSCCLDTFVRRAHGIYEAYQNRQSMLDNCDFESNYYDDSGISSNISNVPNYDCSAVDRLRIEREKLKTDKLEMSKWHREAAREELFWESVVQAIERSPLPHRNCICTVSENLETEKVLLIADQHYGTEFSITGIDGSIINEYSPEIFEARMWTLFDNVVNLCKESNTTTLKICSLGDTLDGLLRFSQLAKLRWGVVETSVNYAKFMVRWLDELSKYVHIKFYNTSGNHTEMRLLDGKKGQHERENIDIVILAIMEAYLRNNKNVEIVKNNTGYIFTDICGYNIFGYHGEDKDLEKSLKEISTYYDVPIDYVFAGHLHHLESSACGARKGTIRAGSIMGTDDFSDKLKRRSDAVAHLLTFTKGKGVTRIDNILLN